MGQFDKHNVDANADLAQRFAELGASDDFVDRIRKFGTDVPDELMHHGKKTTGQSASSRRAHMDGKRQSIHSSEENSDHSDQDGVDGDFDDESAETSSLKEEVVDEFETWFRKNRRPPNPMTDEVRKDVERMLAADPDIARRKEKPRIQNPKATNMLARPTRRGAHDNDAAVYGRRGPEKWVQWRMKQMQDEATAADRSGGVLSSSGRQGTLGVTTLTPARRRELEEWRQKREEERKAREDRERKQEQEDRRAKRILGEHMNDMAKERLQEWTERRRKQLEKGTALREERTRHFNVHGGGVTTGRTQVGRATLKAAHDLDMRDMSTAVARSEALRYFTGIPAGSKVPCTSIPGL